MYKKFPSLKTHHQLLFSLIIMSGMISLWRGIWGLLDLYLFPGQPNISAVISVILGIFVISVTHYTIDKIV